MSPASGIHPPRLPKQHQWRRLPASQGALRTVLPYIPTTYHQHHRIIMADMHQRLSRELSRILSCPYPASLKVSSPIRPICKPLGSGHMIVFPASHQR